MTKKRVLFVCTGNRARSQMGEGLLRHLAGDRFDVYSAGTEPKGLAGETIAAMAEISIDVSGQRSEHISAYEDYDFDYLITVCDIACAALPPRPEALKRLHWDVEDPSDTIARGHSFEEAFRLARDRLRGYVERFVAADNPA
jgi:arsenate reductase